MISGLISKIINILFGCWHLNLSFPITARASRRGVAAATMGTYVVCLDCGREFAYDWNEMKIVGPAPERTTTVQTLAAKEAA